MVTESEIQQRLQIEGPKYNCVLMRNNSGVLQDVNGRPVRYGLMNESKKQNENIKSSDLIGITKIVITPEMVGKTIGVFTAIEVKEEAWKPGKKLDKREIAQKNFIDFIKQQGGFAGFSNSIDSFKLILQS